MRHYISKSSNENHNKWHICIDSRILQNIQNLGFKIDEMLYFDELGSVFSSRRGLQVNARPILINFAAVSGVAQIGELSEYLKSKSCPFLQ